MDSFKAADLPDDEELVSSRCEQSANLRTNRPSSLQAAIVLFRLAKSPRRAALQEAKDRF